MHASCHFLFVFALFSSCIPFNVGESSIGSECGVVWETGNPYFKGRFAASKQSARQHSLERHRSRSRFGSLSVSTQPPKIVTQFTNPFQLSKFWASEKDSGTMVCMHPFVSCSYSLYFRHRWILFRFQVWHSMNILNGAFQATSKLRALLCSKSNVNWTRLCDVARYEHIQWNFPKWQLR